MGNVFFQPLAFYCLKHDLNWQDDWFMALPATSQRFKLTQFS